MTSVYRCSVVICVVLVIFCSAIPDECPTGPRGIESCSGRRFGFYQACDTCESYILCALGREVYKPCLFNTVWDDNKKLCLFSSSTCKPKDGPDGDKCPTGPSGIKSCRGRPKGYYQACDSCSQYIKCFLGKPCEKDCPDSLVWDDKKKKCLPKSSTCKAKKEDSCDIEMRYVARPIMLDFPGSIV